MTYRDDRDATLARAEALEQDLKRAEAERDRLKAEIERLEHVRTTAPPLVVAPAARTVEPVNTIVRLHIQALTPTEIKSLLAEVEVGLTRAHGELVVWKVIFAVVLVGSVPLYFTTVPLAGLTFTLLGLFGLIKYLVVAALNDAQEVFESLRDRPDEILELVESKGSLTIVTRTKSAACSTGNRAALLVQLSRYCPGAIARRGVV